MISLLLTKLLFSLSVVIAAIFLISNSNESFLFLNSIEHFFGQVFGKGCRPQIVEHLFWHVCTLFRKKNFSKM
jgi:hypothetical protein